MWKFLLQMSISSLIILFVCLLVIVSLLRNVLLLLLGKKSYADVRKWAHTNFIRGLLLTPQTLESKIHYCWFFMVWKRLGKIILAIFMIINSNGLWMPNIKFAFGSERKKSLLINLHALLSLPFHPLKK